MLKVRSKRTWHLTADKSRAVPEDDAAGALLLVAAGCSIPAAEIEKYGLLPDGSDYAFGAAPVAEEALPTETDPNTEDHGNQPDDVPPAQ